jgi:hypothetical protein
MALFLGLLAIEIRQEIPSHRIDILSKRTPISRTYYAWFFFSAMLILSIVGCMTPRTLQTTPDFSCRNLDWYETGRSTGNTGSTLSKLDSWKERCNSTPHPVNDDLFVNGYEAGLVEYCSATVGFEAGRNGLAYEDVCPKYLEMKFLTHYELGRRVRSLESENMDLESRIDNLTRLITNGQSGNSLQLQLELLKRRRAQNSSEISILENGLSQTGSARF